MKHKIYNLLMVTHRGLLENTYQQVFFSDSGLSAVKTFDDYLTDFYLYLYEAKPKYVNDDIKGYYLQQIKDEKATPAWLRQTFRRFLLEENRILTEMRDALAEYRRQLASAGSGSQLDITLMHVGFAIAWFDQHESSEDRSLFFRSAYKHFMGFYSWPDDDLDDRDVANILGINPGALRTRTSRLCAKVKRLVGELNDALIASLNRQSLLGKAERNLDQYDQIVELRKEKRNSLRTFEKLESACMAEMSLPCSCFEMDERSCMPEIGSRVVRMFKELIGM